MAVPDTTDKRTIVVLGNSAPVMQVVLPDGSTAKANAEHLRQSETRLLMEPNFDDPERVSLAAETENDRVFSLIYRSLPDEHKHYAIGLAQLEQLWPEHSSKGTPDYVVSDDADFASAISAHFKIPVGRPVALFTTVGRDALHAQHLSTGAQPAAFDYIALTASTTAPAATDTTLTGEISTASGGLIRAIATYAHTAGTNTTTLTKTFTANANDSLPVTVAQIGVFNAAGAGNGTLAYHTALSSTATLSASGDSVTITETVTAG